MIIQENLSAFMTMNHSSLNVFMTNNTPSGMKKKKRKEERKT